MHADIDSKPAFERALGSLAEFVKLLERRRETGYARHERRLTGLTSFVLLGRWHSDSLGNYGRVALVDGRVPKDLFPEIPDVLTQYEFGEFMKARGFDMWSFGLAGDELPPPGDAKCSACGGGWTVADCHEVFWRGGEPHHLPCHRALNAAWCEGSFATMLKLAGFRWIEMAAVPNRYSDWAGYPPWFRIRTEAGVLVMGWRKRVINIDWSALPYLSGGNMFSGENTTVGADHIHAWTEIAAVEYLSKLRTRAETIQAAAGQGACRDCGAESAAFHWGDIVPAGDPGCLCARCAAMRNDYFAAVRSPKPYPAAVRG